MRLSGLLTVAIALLLLSCGTGSKNEEAEQVTFPIRGKIMGIDSAGLRITIAHEEIPDYMAPMTMPFRVRDPALFSEVAVGDSVIGLLAVNRVTSWLASVTVIGGGEVTEGSGQFGQVLRPGDPIPDLVFLNQAGERVRLSAFRGTVVAITFIYTRCPLPDFCIRMSDHFSKIQDMLSRNDPAGGWQLLTVSFDPAFDRPAVLRSYGETYGADFARWQFLTDPDTSGRTVLQLADGFGLVYEDDEEALIAHNLRTALIDREGRLVEVVRDNDWTPGEIVAKMEVLLRAGGE